MSSPFTERKITLIGLSLGLLVLVGLTSFALNRKLEQSEQRETVRELRDIVEEVLLIQTHLSNAESGQRGFLLTQDAQYLGPYNVTVDSLPSVMTRLEQKTNHDPETKGHLEALRLLTEKKLAELRTTLEMTKDNSATAINLVRSNTGRLLMDELTHTLKVILNRQYGLLELADQQERKAADEATHTIIWSAVLALALIGTGTYRVVRDTGAREQADRLIEQTRLLNLAPIMTRDLDGHILSWSQGYERLYGWTQDEAIGKISYHLLQTRFNLPLDEIQHGLSRDGQWSGELTHTRRDGTTIPVSANWTLLQESDQSPATVLEVNTNISELKAAQEAQAQSDNRFRLLADNMSQFAWIADDKGWINWYNNRWFDYTGTTLPEMEGWGWKKVHHPAHVDRVVEKILRCFAAGEVWEDTFPLRGRDGQYRWFLSRAIPIRNAEGRILQWFGTNTDITAHKAAAEAQAFLAAIVTSSPDAILSKSVEGVVLTWNQGAEALFGYTEQDIVSRRVDLIVPEGLRDEEQELRNRVLAGMMVEQFETQRRHRSGRLLEVSISMSPLIDQQHTIIGIAQIIRDISIRKQSEQALKQSEQFQRAVFESSPDCVKVLSRDGHLLLMNERGLCVMDIDDFEPFRGRQWCELWPPEYRTTIEDCLRAARADTTTRFQGYCPTARGRFRWWDVTVTPVSDASGRILVVSRDVTEQHRIEGALRESEERFRNLTTNIPQLIWSCKPDGSCDYLSEQWMAYTGTTLQQNLGYGWLTLIHPDDAPVVDRRWKESVNSGSLFTAEYRLKAADGDYYWHLARATSQRNNAGEVYAWFGTTTNISAQKASEAALEQFNFLLESKSTALAAANKELEAFSYSISHDLRAPLRTMTGFAQALLEDYGDKLEPEATRYLRIISNGATQMGRLIDDLLSFSRLSRQPLAMSTVSIEELVKEVREDFAADQAGRTIEWDMADLPVCQGDRTTIKLVLANLIGNALKYSRTREIAKIQIGWRADDQRTGQCQIFVKDNGVGFDMRYADKLYTVFQRLHRADEFEGTGVGLAIVQRIVHRHGGRVWAEARSNEGATFWFTLENAS